MWKLRKDLKHNNVKDPLVVSVLITYRFGNWVCYSCKVPLLRQVLWIIYRVMDLIVVRIVNGGMIPGECRIGAGLSIPHGANGIILHPSVELGDEVCIFHQVTIGDRNNLGAPKVGSQVMISTGAKLLGPIHIGTYSKIGANVVVITDIPDFSTVVGPAPVVITKTLDPTTQHAQTKDEDSVG